MNRQKNFIVLLFLLLLFFSAATASCHKNKKNIYGRWKATGIYLGKDLEGEIADLNSDQESLFKSILDSAFLNGGYIEFRKNGTYRTKTSGGEFEGYWKMEKYIIRLFPSKEEKDSVVIEIKPDKLVLILDSQRGSAITYIKEK